MGFLRSNGKLATVSAVRPPVRFGGLVIRDERVVEFSEKPQTEQGWINGGFFVFDPGVLDYIEDAQTIRITYLWDLETPFSGQSPPPWVVEPAFPICPDTFWHEICANPLETRDLMRFMPM